MKKIIYGITLLCLMFVGTINVYAETDEHIKIIPETGELKIVEGANASFQIVVFDTFVAGANIKSNNTDAVKINTVLYDQNLGSLKETGKWVSRGEGSNRSLEHYIYLTAVGKTGDTAGSSPL